MSIKFTAIEKGNPQDRDAGKKWYAQARSRGTFDIKELADEVSHRSTVSRADIMAVLYALVEVITEKLKNGYRVKLGVLGTFFMTLASDGAESREKLSSSMIKSWHVRFNPEKDLKNDLKAVSFEKDTSVTLSAEEAAEHENDEATA